MSLNDSSMTHDSPGASRKTHQPGPMGYMSFNWSTTLQRVVAHGRPAGCFFRSLHYFHPKVPGPRRRELSPLETEITFPFFCFLSNAKILGFSVAHSDIHPFTDRLLTPLLWSPAFLCFSRRVPEQQFYAAMCKRKHANPLDADEYTDTC